MKFETTMIALAFGTTLSYAQSAAPAVKPSAEKVFKNVTVLTGIPVDQFMATMGFFSASLGYNCTDCHTAKSGGDWVKYADDTDPKRTARRMIVMVAAINKAYFGGRRVVTCYSCHRGGDRPDVTPSLADLYGPPPAAREPDRMIEEPNRGPTAEQVLDKYIHALGGVQQLSELTSFVAHGIYQRYADNEKHPLEIFAKAPAQRAVIVRNALAGDTTMTYDGSAGWIASPGTDAPIPLMELTGGELEGARLDASLSFPVGINRALRQWRVGDPTEIDDRQVQILQGTTDGKYPINFYFDNKTGLLVRLVRYSESPVGLNPTQIDYSEYREVAGVKIPFRWTVTWLDGRENYELNELKPNVSVDPTTFAKPHSSLAPSGKPIP